MRITIPNEWQPRPHQLPFFQAMDRGKKRACMVWHRRAGKDSASLNYTAKEMIKRTGNYWHLFPKQRQARKAIWNGIDGQGRKILKQVFPDDIVSRSDSTEMMMELKNGSTWQLCGSDNYDSLVGSNPVGVVFSEWSLCDPNAWNYVRPMLAENGGWAIFIYTPRGKNHGHSLYKMARTNENWYAEILTVNDTKRADGSPVITPEIIADERSEGMEEAKVQQEYFCSFDSQIPGAYFNEELATARDDNRVINIPIEKTLPINTSWDLGISDSMSIWFWQSIGKEIRLIHYYENHGKGMEHYIQYLRQFAAKHGAPLGEHLGPHDIEVRELTSGKSRRDTAQEMGIVFRTTKRPRIKAEGIQAVRKLFPRLWFDETRAEHGINCIASYHREYDDKRQCYKDQPVHDWSSHGFDALQTLALGFNERMVAGRQRPRVVAANTGFKVFG